jgi:hypothetical protein
MDGDNKIIAARLEQIRRENGLTLDAMGEITCFGFMANRQRKTALVGAVSAICYCLNSSKYFRSASFSSSVM